MRAILSSVLIILSSAMFFVACKGGSEADIPQKIEEFVTDVQANSSNYTQEDWEKSIEDFTRLMSDYHEHEASYTSEQKQSVANAMGRYHAMVFESAIKESADSIKGLFEELADYSKMLPAYMDGFKNVLESDTLKLENLFSDIFASEPVQELLGRIGSIFGGGSVVDDSEMEVVLDTLGPAVPLDTLDVAE